MFIVDIGTDERKFVEKVIVQEGLGIYDATHAEVESLLAVRASALQSDYMLADMISRRAQIGVFPTLSG